MRLDLRLLEGYKRRAFYTMLCSFGAMIVIGLLADITWLPYIFPSLGPTALMVFGHPLRRDCAPSHAIFGHAIGALSGYFALFVTGLLAVPFSEHVAVPRVIAAAIALGLTAGITVLLHAEHAPAGATTLIVALGILPRPIDFLFLMAAVVMLVILAYIVNHLFAIDYPIWRAPHWVHHHDAELINAWHITRASRGRDRTTPA